MVPSSLLCMKVGKQQLDERPVKELSCPDGRPPAEAFRADLDKHLLAQLGDCLVSPLQQFSKHVHIITLFAFLSFKLRKVSSTPAAVSGAGSVTVASTWTSSKDILNSLCLNQLDSFLLPFLHLTED